jgi:hypothetical protein
VIWLFRITQIAQIAQKFRRLPGHSMIVGDRVVPAPLPPVMLRILPVLLCFRARPRIERLPGGRL